MFFGLPLCLDYCFFLLVFHLFSSLVYHFCWTFLFCSLLSFFSSERTPICSKVITRFPRPAPNHQLFLCIFSTTDCPWEKKRSLCSCSSLFALLLSVSKPWSLRKVYLFSALVQTCCVVLPTTSRRSQTSCQLTIGFPR